MCGIAGIFAPGGVDPAVVPAMLARLRHRGPDGVGVAQGERAGRCVFTAGTARLAIVDPSHGAQPLWDPSGRVLVSLNGELYNHRRLRQELAARGVRFRTQSDTEVFAALIAEVGLRSALDQACGMFALAVWERDPARGWLVRDRMGVKPLYWRALPEGGLAWASEPRALREVPGLRWAENPAALQSVLLYEAVLGPDAAWAEVHRLEAGHLLPLEDGARWRPACWWEPPVPRPGRGGDLARWARSLDGALQVAVSQRLDADVPVGVVLSGGLDSTTVAAHAAAHGPICTFSVAVDAPGFDEGPFARRAAAALRAEHREVRFGPEDLVETIDAVLSHMDEPLADSSLLPSWALYRLVAAAGYKCVLSGDGADESFGGYPTVHAHRLAPLLRPFAPAARAALKRLPRSGEGVSPDYLARRFFDSVGGPWAERHMAWMGAWLPEELGPVAPAVMAPIARWAAAADGTDAVGRALYLDQRAYLTECVLVKVDRASMAHGVEVRSPFLDHRVVTLAADMSSGMKVQGWETKRVLRAAASARVPDFVLQRPKKGFGSPIGPWLRGPARPLLAGLDDALSDLVAPERMRRTIQEHLSGAADHRRRLWSAVTVARWRARG
jgi:asparagine synthase (glutamine-hydrolysing)